MMENEVKCAYGVIRQRFYAYLEVEDIEVAIVKFKNGTVVTIEGTMNVYPWNLEETFYFFVKKRMVKLGGKSTNNIDVWDFTCADMQGGLLTNNEKWKS